MANGPRLSLVEGHETDRPAVEARKEPEDAGPPAESVGELLRRARQRRGKELAEVWRVLKIRTNYLAALEDGDFDELPDRGHTIGFVRSYAAYLGLNAKEIAGRWKEETAAYWGVREPPMEPLPQPREERRQDPALICDPANAPMPAIDFSPEPDSELPRGGRLSAVVLLVGLVYSGYYVFGSSGQASQAVSPVPARLAAESLVPAPVAPPPHKDVVLPAPVLPPPHRDVGPPAPVITPPPAAAPPAPIVTHEPAASVTLTLPPTQVVDLPVKSPPKLLAPLPPGRSYGTANKGSRITLRVHRPTRIAVEGNRNRIFIDRTLDPGDTYRVPNMGGLKLSVPDAGAVELILDGTSRGFAGADGVTAKALPLNPQTIVAHQQRG
jgi:cytoskeleton protein RodZ